MDTVICRGGAHHGGDVDRGHRRPDLLRKRKIRRNLYAGVAAVVVVLITVGVSRLEPAAPRVDRDTVYLDTVQRGPMVRQVRGTGTLVPEAIRWIPATTEGTVERIVIRPGAVVTPDTVIVELRNPELEQTAIEAKLQLDAGEARYRNRVVELDSQQLSQRAALAIPSGNDRGDAPGSSSTQVGCCAPPAEPCPGAAMSGPPSGRWCPSSAPPLAGWWAGSPGARALGSDRFTEFTGEFWGHLATRPYMRARLALAQTLHELGYEGDALDHYRELLRLNPNDNQGVRYLLLPVLFERHQGSTSTRPAKAKLPVTINWNRRPPCPVRVTRVFLEALIEALGRSEQH